MSINAISSVSLYEYYYTINRDDEKKKKSPLADEMKKYGLTPTDNEAYNAMMLERAKMLERQQQIQQNPQEIPNSERPWADIMYQLNISFNTDPKDDIEDIKEELDKLIKDVDDDELTKEVKDLKDYVEDLYINFQNNYSGNINTSLTLTAQLNNLSMLNQVNLL